MSNSALFNALLPNQEDLLAQDPFYLGGVGALRTQTGAPRNSTEAFLLPILKGFGGGTMMGIGEQRVEDKIAPAYSSLLEALTGDPYEFAGADKGKSDLMAAMMGREQKMQKAEAQAELVKSLLGEGLTIDPKTGGVAPIEGYFAAKADGAKQLEEAKTQGQIGAAGYNKDLEDRVANLRKEFSGLDVVKNFATVERSANAINQALKDPSSVSDQELVRYSILLIEPGMAVREGEQAAVANSQSIPSTWKGSITKALTGGTALGADVREGLKRLAMRSYDTSKVQYDRAFERASSEARILGIDPQRITYMGKSTPTAGIFGGEQKSSGGSNVPAGMKLLRNKKTGEEKLVPQ